MKITAAGLACPLGLSLPAACAAMDASLCSIQELPYKDDVGEPLRGAVVPALPTDLPAAERLAELGACALTDCLARASARDWARVPLVVCTRSPEEAPAGTLDNSVLAQLEAQVGTSFHPKRSRVVESGAAGTAAVMRSIRPMLSSGQLGACLLLAIDSWSNARSLAWLLEQERLMTSESSDGVLTGEAAACVLLEEWAPAGTAVLGLGEAAEAATILSREPLLGLGLATAMKQALAEARIDMSEIDVRYCNASGESYNFREQVLALGRLLRKRREDMPLVTLTPFIGETGVAAQAAALAYLHHAFQDGGCKHRTALSTASAVGGGRSAIVLRKEQA
jgi:3-oxoacyl-[acyl-carrier-protein] synthase I